MASLLRHVWMSKRCSQQLAVHVGVGSRGVGVEIFRQRRNTESYQISLIGSTNRRPWMPPMSRRADRITFLRNELRRPLRRELAAKRRQDWDRVLLTCWASDHITPYRGRQRDFVAVVQLVGGENWQTARLRPDDFKRADGNLPLEDWQQ